MCKWLIREFELERRTVAEMGIWYTITAAVSFFIVLLVWVFFTAVTSGEDPDDGGPVRAIFLLGMIFLWLVSLVWFWIGLVRTAWRWGYERLGTEIFRYLQIGIFVMTVLAMLPRKDMRESFHMLPFMLLAFDAAIGVMIFNFLTIAWFARRRIPLHAYWEIGSIVAMIVIQTWIFT